MPAVYKHSHVEDYIEIIAGVRLPSGKENYNLFEPSDPLISLARYDMKIIPSLAEQTIGQSKGYTDKQAKLAVDLVLKYERQLAKHGVDVGPVRTPQFRHAIRQIDRSTRVWIENDTIRLRFPYDPALIDTVRTASRESKGQFRFNRESRVHEAALTEWNLNWIYGFACQQNFTIDATVEQMMSLVLQAEQTSYKIELCYNNHSLDIQHAENSLIEYVQTHLGGFDRSNLLTLCDHAPVLGYTIDKQIQTDVIQEHGTRFWSLCANRNLKVDVSPSPTLVNDIMHYAELTGRFPVFVYEPDLSGRLLEQFATHVDIEQICVLENKKTDAIPSTAKIVYTNKIPKLPVDRIPLMISSAGMIYGGDRQMWLQTAEKVVYFTQDVYNKDTKGKNVCRLD